MAEYIRIFPVRLTRSARANNPEYMTRNADLSSQSSEKYVITEANIIYSRGLAVGDRFKLFFTSPSFQFES